MKNLDKKVYVGVSGGVDSSVSLSLLQEQGYDVTGVFIRVWYPPFVECNWKTERRDAMAVCAHLGVPFKEFDAENEYKKDVVDYMIEEYKKGRTPNPDIMCNRSVKFGAFKDWALAEGAQYIATGHYSRVAHREGSSGYSLLMGVDQNKDQTYFLWTLEQDDLKHTIFPVGDMQKDDVRAYAKEKGLMTAGKKDSQGVCFLGALDMKEFLSHYINLVPGDVIDVGGKVIGTHKGSEIYTIGERHGFEVVKKSPNDAPRYIVSKDVNDNTITVSEKKNLPTQKKEFKLEKVNWIDEEPSEGETYQGRVRYRQKLQECNLYKAGEVWNVVFEDGQDFAAPGQSFVLYRGEVCLGGGVLV